MKPKQFLAALCGASFEHVFNPYAQRCSVHDRAGAAGARARTLGLVLASAAEREIDSLWLGRDLGWRGGRRTGLAFTDDLHLEAHLARWGLTAPRPTRGAPVAEQTAAVVWSKVVETSAAIFLWNVFPFHPHEPGAPFTNRAHDARERAVGEAYLAELLRMLRPRRIVAIGAAASLSAARVAPCLPTARARHPSYGGQREFLAQIDELAAIEARAS